MKKLNTIYIPVAFLSVLLLALCVPSVVLSGSADYRTIVDGTYPSVTLGGTTVTGSSSIVSASYVGYRGLGIDGGGSNLSLDVGETMTIDFSQLVTNTKVMINDIEPVGNVAFGFIAFNGAANLGTFPFPLANVHEEVYDLMALDGNMPMTKFTIFVQNPSAPYGLQIQGVSYDSASAVPEPTTILLLGSGLIGLAGYGRKKLFKK